MSKDWTPLGRQDDQALFAKRYCYLRSATRHNHKIPAPYWINQIQHRFEGRIWKMAFAVDQKAIHIKQHSFVMHEKLSFVLRQSIGDIVVIAFLADKNMNVGFYICRPVKGPHGNGCPVCFNDGIKKQVGPTGFTKPTADFLGRLVPRNIFLLWSTKFTCWREVSRQRYILLVVGHFEIE